MHVIGLIKDKDKEEDRSLLQQKKTKLLALCTKVGNLDCSLIGFAKTLCNYIMLN